MAKFVNDLGDYHVGTGVLPIVVNGKREYIIVIDGEGVKCDKNGFVYSTPSKSHVTSLYDMIIADKVLSEK